MQRVFDPAVNHATIAVLQANGVEVVLPASQGCCGAASHHQGELEQTRDLARDLVKQFEGETLDAVLVAASGCGHTLKQYGELLPGEKGFSAPVLDVHEFLSQIGLSEAFQAQLQPLPKAVAYHDACHMIHAARASPPSRGNCCAPSLDCNCAKPPKRACAAAAQGSTTWCSPKKPRPWASSKPLT